MIATLAAWVTSSLGLFIEAAIAVLLVGSAAARFDRRRRELRRQRTKERQAEIDAIVEHATSGSAGLIALAVEPAWFAACETDRKKEDDKAVRLQARYYSCVARCVGVLGFGVVIMCLSIVIWRDILWLKKFATHFDLIAAFYAGGYFLVARSTNRMFVITRSFVETLRAWIHLALILPLEKSGDVSAAYSAKKKEIAARFWSRAGAAPQDAGGDTNDWPDERETLIYKRVQGCWTELHAQCRIAGLRRPSISADLGFYVRERPLDQLKFFLAAQGRIYDGTRRREVLMIVLYVASILLAVFKALSVFNDDLQTTVSAHVGLATAMPVEWISTALLVVMVLSAAATNAYISRNERSLLHSYHAQQRRIRKWFETFAMTSGGGAGPHTTLDTVIAFEEMMLNDLLDFIHITSRDVIEVPGH